MLWIGGRHELYCYFYLGLSTLVNFTIISYILKVFLLKIAKLLLPIFAFSVIHICCQGNIIGTLQKTLILANIVLPLSKWSWKYLQKLMTMKHLNLIQSWGFLSLKVTLFGCDVRIAHAFSCACNFNLFWSIFGHKIGVLKFQGKELQVTRFQVMRFWYLILLSS